jgi:hypothetical protein
MRFYFIKSLHSLLKSPLFTNLFSKLKLECVGYNGVLGNITVLAKTFRVVDLVVMLALEGKSSPPFFVVAKIAHSLIHE